MIAQAIRGIAESLDSLADAIDRPNRLQCSVAELQRHVSNVRDTLEDRVNSLSRRLEAAVTILTEHGEQFRAMHQRIKSLDASVDALQGRTNAMAVEILGK